MTDLVRSARFIFLKFVIMKKYFSLLTAILLISCSNSDRSNENSAAESELTGKTYDYLLFESEQECINAQPDPNFFLNCHREIHFVDDRNAQIMLTDMVIPVKYTIEANKIVIDFSTDQSSTLTFEKVNSSSLKLLNDDSVWNERTGESIWD